jgi:hypothetical protein
MTGTHPFNDEWALNLAQHENLREPKEDNEERRSLQDAFKDAAIMFSVMAEQAKAVMIAVGNVVQQPFRLAADARSNHGEY